MATLITFPPSLDSELARFILVHYRITYRESPHTLVFSSLATLWHGHTPVFPCCYGRGFKLAGPLAIVDHFDSQALAELRLRPGKEEFRQCFASVGR